MSAPALQFPVNDRSFYPLHEEDDVPEITRHEGEVRDLRDVLSCRFPGRFVTGNVCIYWIPGETQQYYAPDVFVTAAPPAEPEPRVYHTWQDPQIVFVAEERSRSLTQEQWQKNFKVCEQQLRVPEFLDFDPEELRLRMWRLGAQEYEPVEAEANGRLRSRELDLDFGINAAGRLRVYTREGDLLRTHKEAERDREQAERDREQAEALAAEEARQRLEAEARAAEEAQRRQEAETRATEEARQRLEAETRAAEQSQRREELERQVAALQAELDRRRDEG